MTAWPATNWSTTDLYSITVAKINEHDKEPSLYSTLFIRVQKSLIGMFSATMGDDYDDHEDDDNDDSWLGLMVAAVIMITW